MSRQRKFFNPVYLLLGIVGAVFCVSACVYGVMTVKLTRAAGDWAQGEPTHPLMLFFREHGGLLLGVELSILAVLTVAAIWSDDYWARRGRRAAQDR